MGQKRRGTGWSLYGGRGHGDAAGARGRSWGHQSPHRHHRHQCSACWRLPRAASTARWGASSHCPCRTVVGVVRVKGPHGLHSAVCPGPQIGSRHCRLSCMHAASASQRQPGWAGSSRWQAGWERNGSAHRTAHAAALPAPAGSRCSDRGAGTRSAPHLATSCPARSAQHISTAHKCATLPLPLPHIGAHHAALPAPACSRPRRTGAGRAPPLSTQSAETADDGTQRSTL